MMRTFVALEIPHGVKQQMHALQDHLKELPALREQPSLLRWTNTRNLHLTLRFLGDTDESQRHQLQNGLAAVAAKHAPFSLTPSRLGCFRSWANLRVLWVGLEGESEALQGLQADVESLARQVGFPPERNSFSPHITLARTARNAARPALRAASEQLRRTAEDDESRSWNDWKVSELHFIRSVLGPGGAQYFNLATCALPGDTWKTY
ncbi:MAG: RNA 2',3'-cyclic phosphodiesterase [Caldilineaceae bacterium]|nr:RNA 2',3'-cyclic phosphodiesterase [Caldilineaceae bacterium]